MAVCVLFERRDALNAGVVLELAARGEEWRLCLAHLLLQEAEKPSRVVAEVCRREGVRLTRRPARSWCCSTWRSRTTENLLRLESFVAEEEADAASRCSRR